LNILYNVTLPTYTSFLDSVDRIRVVDNATITARDIGLNNEPILV